jgi:DNA mismatch repair protein MutL
MERRFVRAGEGARPRIQRLPDGLVDQIAAGEVVERPASVVKELVENALDAGAARVRVEVRDGGVRSISVADDGWGMTPAEARLALERHVTSKLSRSEDLADIRSYGFRGEALPAIASVSRLRLVTRARGSNETCELRVEAGRMEEGAAAGAPEGTRIEVAELFASVPARRKFLKSPQTEWGHVSEWLAKAALALPSVHFDVRRDERAALAWPAASDPLERIAAVLGEEEAAGLVHAARDAGDLVLDAFVSRPDRHRASGAGLHLFVNGRPVRDRLLRHALLDVYRDLLPRGRFPAALLFLRVAAGGVDVNVHPAKWEVRFADPRAVHHLVSATVREALGSRSWLGARAAPAAIGAAPHRAAPAWEAAPDRVREGAPADGPGDWLFAARPTRTEARPDDAPASGGVPRPFRFGELRVLGQLLGTYLLLETKEGLLLVDQHAAHERVLYEGLRAAWLAEGVPRQPLLLPETLELEVPALAALVGCDALVETLGFEVEPFGETAVLVRAVPALIAGRDPLGALRGLADQLRSAGEGAPAPASRLLDSADRWFASVACHSARRAGELLRPEEQRALADALDAIPWAPTCPHGRPVAVPISETEIARRFGRT